MLLSEGDLSSILKVANAIPPMKQREMSAQGKWLYSTYFSSMESITLTTLNILNDRVYPQYARVYEDWNNPPHSVSFLYFYKILKRNSSSLLI